MISQGIGRTSIVELVITTLREAAHACIACAEHGAVGMPEFLALSEQPIIKESDRLMRAMYSAFGCNQHLGK